MTSEDVPPDHGPMADIEALIALPLHIQYRFIQHGPYFLNETVQPLFA